MLAGCNPNPLHPTLPRTRWWPPRHDPPVSPVVVLLVAAKAFSWAGPLVRFSDAPALAISAWRLLLSVALIGVVLALRSR